MIIATTAPWQNLHKHRGIGQSSSKSGPLSFLPPRKPSHHEVSPPVNAWRICRMARLFSILSLRLFFFSPGSQIWQNSQLRPFSQPFVYMNAHGLHLPMSCPTEPILGIPLLSF